MRGKALWTSSLSTLSIALFHSRRSQWDQFFLWNLEAYQESHLRITILYFVKQWVFLSLSLTLLTKLLHSWETQPLLLLPQSLNTQGLFTFSFFRPRPPSGNSSLYSSQLPGIHWMSRYWYASPPNSLCSFWNK
jgi:hypothetical protein